MNVFNLANALEGLDAVTSDGGVVTQIKSLLVGTSLMFAGVVDDNEVVIWDDVGDQYGEGDVELYNHEL